MKKKLLFITFVAALMLLAFALTAGAQEISSVDPQFGAVESIEGAGEASAERVKLVCGDHYHTYPSSYVVTDAVSLTFDFTAVSANGCGVTYTKNNVVAFEMPESVTTMPGAMFQSNTSIKYFKISKSFTGFGGNNTFDGSSLEWFDFNENTNVKEIKQSTFCGCKSLKGICFPDQMTTMGVYCLANCPNLGPVYLPASLTTFLGDYSWPTFAPPGGNESSGREFNKNMYFVNEKFTDPAKAEKPTVYYMPENITSLWNTGFRGMSNVNDVIVFSEKTVNFDTGYDNIFNIIGTSADKEKTVVFLGNVTKLRVYENVWNLNLVFANENDTGIDSITFNYLERVSSDPAASAPAKMYFCKTGAVYGFNGAILDIEMQHFIDARKDTSKDLATCDKNATNNVYCYCGAHMGVKELEGTMLGHSHTEFIDLVYDDFSKAGYYSYKCERCDDVNNEQTAPALFTNKGYSAAEYAGGGMSIGFKVDKNAIIAYEEATGKNVSYGVFAVLAEKIGANDIFDADGKALEGVIAADITNTGFDIFNLKIVGFTGDQVDKDLVMGAYVGVSKDGATEYAYLQDVTSEKNEKYYFASYNDVKAIVDAKNGVSAQ